MPLARSKAPHSEPLPFLRRRRDWKSRMRALLHRLELKRHAASAPGPRRPDSGWRDLGPPDEPPRRGIARAG